MPLTKSRKAAAGEYPAVRRVLSQLRSNLEQVWITADNLGDSKDLTRRERKLAKEVAQAAYQAREKLLPLMGDVAERLGDGR